VTATALKNWEAFPQPLGMVNYATTIKYEKFEQFQFLKS
jgi:hypothetical protein